MLVKAHKMTARWVWTVIVVQYLEDCRLSEQALREIERTEICLSSVRNCEKPLSVTAIKSCLGLTERLGQKNLLLYWLLNNT